MDKAIDIYILNPDYSFKNDMDRVVMYSKKSVQAYSTSDWVGYIHPLQADILNSFSDYIDFSSQCTKLAQKYAISCQQAKDMIEQFICNETPVYTEFSGNKIVFPKNVLIPASYVNNKHIVRRKCYLNVDAQIDLTPDRMHSAPQSMLLMLTNKCVTKCKYCYADKETQCTEMSTEKILDIIEQAGKLQMSYVDVIGGEVFCRKDWNVILKALVDNDLMPNFISTKCPLSEKTVRKLYDTGYSNVVQVSLDSLSESVLEDIIGCKNSYVEKIKEAIGYLEKYGFQVQINTILTKKTAVQVELDKLYEYIKNIKNLAYWEIRIPEKSIYSPITFDEVKASRRQLENICAYVKNTLMSKASFKIICSDEVLNEHIKDGKTTDECFFGGTCGLLQSAFFVLPDGKVSVCEQMYWHPQYIIGDLNKQTIEEVWQSSKAKELFCMNRKKFREESACHSCKIFDMCNKKHRRCAVKIIRAYGKQNWDYPDPRCQYADKVKPQYSDENL